MLARLLLWASLIVALNSSAFAEDAAESVADEATDEAIRFRDAKSPVDPHSADQLLLPLVFSNDASEFRTSEITRHLTTNMATVRKFVDLAMELDGEVGQPGTVSIAALV